MEQSVFQTIQKIVRPEFVKYFEDWVEIATEEDLDGIQIIDYIMKTRGQRKSEDHIKNKDIHVRELLENQFK